MRPRPPNQCHCGSSAFRALGAQYFGATVGAAYLFECVQCETSIAVESGVGPRCECGAFTVLAPDGLYECSYPRCAENNESHAAT